MQTLTINIANDTLLDKVMWLLEHFKKDGLEIVSKEDIKDMLKNIIQTYTTIHQTLSKKYTKKNF